MMRLATLAAAFWLTLCAGFAFADPVTLRARVEASGRAITLGDVFDGAGAAGSTFVAPAPPAGQMTTISVAVLAAAASAQGLQWTPPPGLTEVRVIRPGGARATLPAASHDSRSVSDAAVRRGEMVSTVFLHGGLQMTMRARALEDAAVGQSVRLQNTSSNRPIDAIVTAPGMARAVGP
ncbi:MAG TPA: flagella basal body P-ring formation protein FlgA [Terricaulis sp.]|nr:flagella basal body P-ring formation protein FlgA [Terricaulis sp.]